MHKLFLQLVSLHDIIAFFDLNLNLKFQKSHTSAPKRKEMAYELRSRLAGSMNLDKPAKNTGEDYQVCVRMIAKGVGNMEAEGVPV
jgi:hypothetical protein